MTPTDEDANPRALPTARALRSPEPSGATLAFVEAVRTKYGEPFANSWLSSRVCRFTDTTVFTIAFARDTIVQYCEALMQKHGVTVAVCPDVTRGLYNEVDARGGRS
ncbi:MAG: hypothetical protein KJZ75_11360 [Hyphomonadaceae bacterium]|nr:hypothetical protein [Hyphomonadaceae bacterium]